MGKLAELALGIVTAIGGFLEIGSIVTSAQAGADFGFQLGWAILLGGICVSFLVEMSGRFAAISKHTIVGAMRERFGFSFFLLPLIALTIVMQLVLAAEIGGCCIALEFATGIAHQWWALPVGAVVWALLWAGTFKFIEDGASLLGLVTVCFVVAAVMLRPPLRPVLGGLLPTLPSHDGARYGFLAVSILGASVSPYLMYFYSSGAIEDRWTEDYLPINRIVAGVGMMFGAGLAVAVLIVAAVVLPRHGVHLDDYRQLPLLLEDPLGRWGLPLIATSIGVACLGASLEIGLEMAYFIAQGFGWNWGKGCRPREAARFTVVYTVAVLLGSASIAAGINPLSLTVVSMTLTALTLPVAIGPFVILMNDEAYLGAHRNGWISNAVVVFTIALGFVLALVTLPLQIWGGG